MINQNDETMWEVEVMSEVYILVKGRCHHCEIKGKQTNSHFPSAFLFDDIIIPKWFDEIVCPRWKTNGWLLLHFYYQTYTLYTLYFNPMGSCLGRGSGYSTMIRATPLSLIPLGQNSSRSCGAMKRVWFRPPHNIPIGNHGGNTNSSIRILVGEGR